jgi:magnesium chelatase family protein
MDELPEFNRNVLEILRQPLEDGQVTIARAAAALTYPANFMLVAAMNPCPCGYYGDPVKPCNCSPTTVQKYLQRISGPLLDRIDLHVEAPRLRPDELTTPPSGEKSAAIRQRVEKARDIQRKRFQGYAVYCNAQMTPRLLRECAAVEGEALTLLRAAIDAMSLSARAYDRILKVARTIADLAGEENIGIAHVAESVQYRALDRKFWA